MTENITKVTNEQAEAEAEIREKGHRIAEYQNMVKYAMYNTVLNICRCSKILYLILVVISCQNVERVMLCSFCPVSSVAYVHVSCLQEMARRATGFSFQGFALYFLPFF